MISINIDLAITPYAVEVRATGTDALLSTLFFGRRQDALDFADSYKVGSNRYVTMYKVQAVSREKF
jgi:hypothetical protein